MKLKAKIDAAKKAISDIHSDTSVPKAETVSALEEVFEHVDGFLTALELELDKEPDDEA